MEAAKGKTILGIITAVLAYLKGSFNELLVVLAILMIFDYILGTTLALMSGSFTREKGIRGAVKKAGYMFLVTIGFLLDFTITFLADSTGLVLNTGGMFGYAITCYLIGTEGLSCLKCMGELGLPIPDFLLRGFGMLKDSAENPNKKDKSL